MAKPRRQFSDYKLWEIFISLQNLLSEFAFVIWQKECLHKCFSKFASINVSSLFGFASKLAALIQWNFWVFSVYIRSRAAPPPSSLKALNRPKCVKYRVQITAVLMTGYENERWQQLLLMILPNCHCCLDNPPCFFPTLNHQRRRGRTAEPWLMLLLFIGNLDRVHFRVNMEAEKNTLKC